MATFQVPGTLPSIHMEPDVRRVLEEFVFLLKGLPNVRFRLLRGGRLWTRAPLTSQPADCRSPTTPPPSRPKLPRNRRRSRRSRRRLPAPGRQRRWSSWRRCCRRGILVVLCRVTDGGKRVFFSFPPPPPPKKMGNIY